MTELVPTKQPSLSVSQAELEVAWAAGLFDGEGSTSVQFHKKRKHGRPTFRLTLSQSGEHADTLLARFHSAVGGRGRIYGPYQLAPPRKPKMNWAAHNSEAYQVYCVLRPYLSKAKVAQATWSMIFWKYGRSAGY